MSWLNRFKRSQQHVPNEEELNALTSRLSPRLASPDVFFQAVNRLSAAADRIEKILQRKYGDDIEGEDKFFDAWPGLGLSSPRLQNMLLRNPNAATPEEIVAGLRQYNKGKQYNEESLYCFKENFAQLIKANAEITKRNSTPGYDTENIASDIITLAAYIARVEGDDFLRSVIRTVLEYSHDKNQSMKVQ